jgi:hypothetical protein
MSQVDDITLSSYLDGELDYDQTKVVTEQIHHDPVVRDRLAGMASIQALLKAYGREKEREEIPDSTIETLRHSKQRKIFPLMEKRVLQAAAVLLLFIGSFLLGRNNSDTRNLQSSNFPVIPAALEQTINEVLENQKSGSPQSWVEIEKNISARVTPVRSFRGGQGEFYRMFVVDMVQAGSEQHIWGMAIRSGKKSWQTKGVFTNGTPGNI